VIVLVIGAREYRESWKRHKKQELRTKRRRISIEADAVESAKAFISSNRHAVVNKSVKAKVYPVVSPVLDDAVLDESPEDEVLIKGGGPDHEYK
jgi:hypothetical protein